MDRNYRWSIYAVSCVASVLYASVNVLALRRGKTEVSFETAILFCLFFALGIRLYAVLRGIPPETSVSQIKPAYSDPVFGFIPIAVVFGLIIVSQSSLVPRLQAAVIDARLEKADRSISYVFTIQSPERADAELRERFQGLESVADTAHRYEIPVDLDRVYKAAAMVRASLQHAARSDQTKQAGLIASAKLVDLAALRRTEGNTVRSPGYVINAPV